MTNNNVTTEIKTYYIGAILLTEPEVFSQAWDNGGQYDPNNWGRNKLRCVEYQNYQQAWNRLQQLYSINKTKLAQFTFFIIENSKIYATEAPISSVDRAEELFNYYAKSKRE